MNSDRPVDLPLLRLAAAMPVTAAASILHRITGVVLFAGTFLLCYLLDQSLGGTEGFAHAVGIVESTLGKLALIAVLTSLAYHVVAGVKHLLLDFHVGDSLRGGRIGSWFSIVAALAAGVAVVAWLW